MQKSLNNHPVFQLLAKSAVLNFPVLQEFLQFEEKIKQLASYLQIDLAQFKIDHLALRVNSSEKAQIWLEHLLKFSNVLSDNEVNGRPIYLLELHKPLFFAQQNIKILELPFPKDKIYSHEGFEHIEVVYPFLPSENEQQWKNRVIEQFSLNQFNDIKVKISTPKAQGEQLPNPSIALSYLDKQKNHTCIKIHPYSIDTIIGGIK